MKKILLAAAVLYSAACFSQSIDFINQVDGKKTVTVSDAAQIFNAVDKVLPRDAARTDRLKVALDKYSKADGSFTKGAAAFVAAEFMGINSSLMYSIFKNERYAFRACAAEGLFSRFSGQSEAISGSELLELAANISKRYGVE